ncbi:MAG: thioesterase [Spirochaetaceae bacterium]|jgi:medium-chain acyl-[acyl-carrier-protein] hydrolase|nr:thioesterase [Spirochaetaceae bacterium]
MLIKSLSMEEVIRSYQVGPGETLTLTSMMQLFQEAAYQHAEQLGWGYIALAEKGMFWLLSRMTIKIIDWPHWNQKITITTAPYTPTGLYAPRDFTIQSEQGQDLILATSHWLLVDKEKMRPLPPKKLFGLIEFQKEQGLCALPMKKLPRQERGKLLFHRKVGLSLLDQNNHVNNTRYMDILLDSLDDKILADIKKVELHYQQEALLGEELQLLGDMDEEGHHFRSLHRGNDSIFSARFTLGEI